MTWYRDGEAALDKMRHRQGQEGTRYTLTINKVQSSDLGSYRCRAQSDLGTVTADIELTGQSVTRVRHGQLRSDTVNPGQTRSREAASGLERTVAGFMMMRGGGQILSPPFNSPTSGLARRAR